MRRLFVIAAVCAAITGCGGAEDAPTAQQLDPRSDTVIAIDLDYDGENWQQIKRLYARAVQEGGLRRRGVHAADARRRARRAGVDVAACRSPTTSGRCSVARCTSASAPSRRRRCRRARATCSSARRGRHPRRRGRARATTTSTVEPMDAEAVEAARGGAGRARAGDDRHGGLPRRGRRSARTRARQAARAGARERAARRRRGRAAAGGRGRGARRRHGRRGAERTTRTGPTRCCASGCRRLGTAPSCPNWARTSSPSAPRPRRSAPGWTGRSCSARSRAPRAGRCAAPSCGCGSTRTPRGRRRAWTSTGWPPRSCHCRGRARSRCPPARAWPARPPTRA